MEPIEGKLVESENLPPPNPLSMYALWSWDGEEWEWDGTFRTAKEAKDYAVGYYRVYRVIHFSDQPPQLPDREKLLEWVNGHLYPIRERTRPLSAIVADCILTLLRDGIPAELMPDAK